MRTVNGIKKRRIFITLMRWFTKYMHRFPCYECWRESVTFTEQNDIPDTIRIRTGWCEKHAHLAHFISTAEYLNNKKHARN